MTPRWLRRWQSWRARTHRPSDVGCGEKQPPWRHCQVAGGVSQEADLLKTLSLFPEIERLRKENTGCNHQSENWRTQSPRWSDGG